MLEEAMECTYKVDFLISSDFSTRVKIGSRRAVSFRFG